MGVGGRPSCAGLLRSAGEAVGEAGQEQDRRAPEGVRASCVVGDRGREWNGKFRDDIRRFVRGDCDTVARLPNRLLASPDLFGDRPAEVEALLRATLPAVLPAEKKRAAARSMVNKIGVVRWSQAHETLWFRQGNGAPYRVHPSRLTDAQRAQVATLEPKGKLRDGHIAGRAPPPSE